MAIVLLSMLSMLLGMLCMARDSHLHSPTQSPTHPHAPDLNGAPARPPFPTLLPIPLAHWRPECFWPALTGVRGAAAGIAGAVSRSLTAPVDRLKMLLQVGSSFQVLGFVRTLLLDVSSRSSRWP